jgi:hypothetical protein
MILALFTFVLFFSAKWLACGPEERAGRGKSIGGWGIPGEDPPGFPPKEAGAPTKDNLSSRRKNGLPARAEKRHLPHGFFAPCPCFRAWQCLQFAWSNGYLAKSEGGKLSDSVDTQLLFFYIQPTRKRVLIQWLSQMAKVAS